MEFTLIVADCL